MLKQIKGILSSSEKPIKSQASLKNYAGHLHRLCRFTNSTPQNLFTQKDSMKKILQFIDTRKSASTKNQLCCSIKKLADIQNNTGFIKFCEKEVQKTIVLRKSKKEKLKILKKKTDNWIDFKVLKKRYELSLEIVRFYKGLKLDLRSKDICQDYHDNLELAVLLGLYISDVKINPPRRAEAWYNCKIVKKTPTFKEAVHNYLVTSKGVPKKIVLYKYKTFHQYGRVEYIINKDLAFLLKQWIEYQSDIPGDYLFKKGDGERWSNTQFSNKIKNVIRRCCVKKINVSTNMLRNIAITHLYKDIEIVKIPMFARMCGHNFETAVENYINANELSKDTIITEQMCDPFYEED